jgi:hypothetical protein
LQKDGNPYIAKGFPEMYHLRIVHADVFAWNVEGFLCQVNVLQLQRLLPLSCCASKEVSN